MYAVIKTGGKQYRVTEGDSLRVEKLEADEGATIEFDKVLMMGQGADVTLGKPFIDGGKVVATVEEQGRARKVDIIKFKRRKGHRRTKSHRQSFTRVRVNSISAG